MPKDQRESKSKSYAHPELVKTQATSTSKANGGKKSPEARNLNLHLNSRSKLESNSVLKTAVQSNVHQTDIDIMTKAKAVCQKELRTAARHTEIQF